MIKRPSLCQANLTWHTTRVLVKFIKQPWWDLCFLRVSKKGEKIERLWLEVIKTIQEGHLCLWVLWGGGGGGGVTSCTHLDQNASFISIHLQVPGTSLHPAHWRLAVYTCLINAQQARAGGAGALHCRTPTAGSLTTGRKAKLVWVSAVKRQRWQGKMEASRTPSAPRHALHAFPSENSPVGSHLGCFKSFSCLPGLAQPSFHKTLQRRAWQGLEPPKL